MANIYNNMSVIEALNLINDNKMILPDIQRNYVWDYTEIEKLFESILDNYPIGTCIIWKTNKEIINKEQPNLYKFIREYKKDNTINEKMPEFITKDGDYYIVLDGQQRITSMNIALFGSYTSYKGGKGNLKTNPKSWIKRELYLNFDYYNSINNEDDEYPLKRFVFLNNNEFIKGKHYKIKNLLQYKDDVDLIEDLQKTINNRIIIKDLKKIFSRINDNSNTGLIHYYCIDEPSYDKALDIFVRVNSTGRKLSKSDLLFSTLIGGWKKGRDEIENLILTINNKGEEFNFSRDYLMRLSLVLVDENTSLKIESLNNNTIKKIIRNWNNIKDSIEKTSDLLVKLGLSDKYLTSYNATMPLAYYIYKGGTFDEDSINEARKFLSIALAKKLFGIASNDALRKTRDALKNIDCKKVKFNVNIFKKIELTGNRNFRITEDEIDYWLDNYQKGQNTFIILSLLYKHLKLNLYQFHQDHCHPYVSFERKNIKNLKINKGKSNEESISEETINTWKFKRNLIPNLQFLEGTENESKNKMPLKDWIAEGHKIEYMPDDCSLELSNFENFFNKRRELIKKELIKIFGL